MKNDSRPSSRFMRGASLPSTTFSVFAAVLLLACSDPHSNYATSTRPSLTSQGGTAGLSGVASADGIAKGAGITRWFSRSDTSYYAPVLDSWAAADSQVGIPSPVAFIGNWPGGSRADTAVDSLNNVHVLAYWKYDGEPPFRVQHFINEELRSDQTMLWVWTENGPVMTESALEVYTPDGDTLALWTSNSGDIARAGLPVLEALTAVALSPLRFLAPTPLAAQHYWACRREWVAYMAAGLALDGAIVGLIATGSELAVFAVVGASGAAGRTLNNLLQCFWEQER